MTLYTVSDKILSRLYGSRGSVWSAKDFLDLGTRASVDQALRRLTLAGKIRRVARGLYDFPRAGAIVSQRAPDPRAVAKAAARARGAHIVPTGAAAANALGLTTQVPARADYLTDGPSKQIDLNGRRVRLKRVSPKRLANAGTAGAVIEAFRYLGQDAVSRLSNADLARVSRALRDGDTRGLQRAVRNAPDWMRPTLDRIAKGRTGARTSRGRT